MTDHLEKGMRETLLSFAAVTALVGQKVRPYKLGENDTLPAILLEVPRDVPAQDLSDDDPAEGLARIDVVRLAHTREGARELAEAARTNGTVPGTGLAGYRGPAGDLEFDPVTIESIVTDAELATDDGDDGDWYFETLQCDVWYRRA